MKTMLDVLRQLEKEMSFEEAKSIFEWYCETYHVGIDDTAPDSIVREVF